MASHNPDRHKPYEGFGAHQERRRFQFSLKDLLLAITFLAIGLPGAMMPVDKRGIFLPFGVHWLIWLASVTAIGAGVGAIFQKKRIGAIVCFSMAFACFLFCMAVMWFVSRLGIGPPG